MKIVGSFCFILLLSIITVLPLLHSGFFPMHDDTQVARVFEMGKALKDGMFPVRWVSDLGYGYGYPIFNFYAPLAYYVGGLITLFGIDALTATKAMMIFGILFSAVSMYLFAKEFWGEKGGIVSALFYVYAPYHAVDIYVRGDVSEFFAYAFIPLVFYGLWKLYTTSKWRYVLVSSAAYAGVILSHNLTGLMITPFIIIILAFLIVQLYKTENKTAVCQMVTFFLLGLSISAFYWVPALLEIPYTNVVSQVGGGADFRDHFVCLFQLWESPWGYGGSVPGCVDGMSFRIGKIHVLLALFSIFLAYSFFTSMKKKFFAFKFALIFAIFCIFMTLDLSKFLWQIIGPMAFFQYPWRFLLLIAFFLSFMGGSIFLSIPLIFNFTKKHFVQFIIFLGCITILLWMNAKLFVPQTIFNATAQNYTNTKSLKYITSKVSDEYLPKDFQKPKSFDEVPKNRIQIGSGIITRLSEKTQIINATINVKAASPVMISLSQFPAWHLRVDGKDQDFNSPNGLRMMLNSGTHEIHAQFVQTTAEKIGNTISLTSILVIILGIISSKRRLLRV